LTAKSDVYAALVEAVGTRKDELRKLLRNIENGDGDKDGSIEKIDAANT
jgi:hypothetical protein